MDKSKNKGSNVFYGEYSLSHWIELLLKKNIILPTYQRHFVWDEERVTKLMETFYNHEFVPPVIIGAHNNMGALENLILDGQQRLTSILISYVGYMPDKKFLRKLADESYADEDDFYDDEKTDIWKWTFRNWLTDNPDENKREEIRKRIGKSEEYYEYTKGLNLDEKFYDETFLGFSYIVPNNKEETAQQKFYSSVFRNINRQGISLQPEESRESLYYLNKDMYQLFQPEFAKRFKVTKPSGGSNGYLDFTRCLSFLFQYLKNDCSSNKIAQHFSGKRMETYYEDFIYHVVGDKPIDRYYDFKKVFPNNNFQDRQKLIIATCQELGLEKKIWPSIIDLDTYFFGLIFYVFINEKRVDSTRGSGLFKELDSKIDEYKDTNSEDNKYHSKNPAALKYLRRRLGDSIAIYKKYLR